MYSCDLLRKLYLCGSITTYFLVKMTEQRCDLLRKLYLCGSITTTQSTVLAAA